MYTLNKANGYGANKQGKSLQMWVKKRINTPFKNKLSH